MEIKIKFKPNPGYRLMDQIREVLRYYHYAYRTEQSYSSWIFQYIKFYGGKTHPKYMGKNEAERFFEIPYRKEECCCGNPKTGIECIDIFRDGLLDFRVSYLKNGGLNR